MRDERLCIPLGPLVHGRKMMIRDTLTEGDDDGDGGDGDDDRYRMSV